MVDREKVMKALRCLSNPYIQDMDERDCENCKYDNSCCFLDVTADALSLLKAQEPKETAHWIHCKGKSHIWYCSNCGGKISYNNARMVYTKGMKPIEEVNRFCRGCGATMIGAVEET